MPSLDGVRHRATDGPPARVQNQLIAVAPAPVLPGLEGLDDGVTGTVEVPGSVLVLGLIAAPNMPTGHAETQVDPGVADPEAVLAAVRAWCHLAHLIEVGTSGHRRSPCRCGSGSGRSRVARSHPARVAPTS